MIINLNFTKPMLVSTGYKKDNLKLKILDHTLFKAKGSSLALSALDNTIEIDVPKSLNKSKVLLHVRGMDGNSVNSLYSR